MSQYRTTHLEASEMLAEALKQMDGLLATPTFQNETPREYRPLFLVGDIDLVASSRWHHTTDVTFMTNQ